MNPLPKSPVVEKYKKSSPVRCDVLPIITVINESTGFHLGKDEIVP